MSLQQENGRWGEDVAVDYLRQRGYDILNRNWRYKHAEIDIIAQTGEILVFLEVKMRSGIAFGRPEEMVSVRKQRLLIKAAQAYTDKLRFEGEIRFDIISIIGRAGKGEQIEHFMDAFFPGLDFGS